MSDADMIKQACEKCDAWARLGQTPRHANNCPNHPSLDSNLRQCKICLAEVPVNQGHTCTDTPQGRKDDGGKDPWHLLPWQAVRQIVHVLEFGRKKYGANNWQGVEDARERYFSAAIRHLTAWYNGEDKDAESGLHHLAHAGCCVVFLLWFEINGQSKI